MRVKLRHNIDSRVFTHTAKKTKMINLYAYPVRGGERL